MTPRKRFKPMKVLPKTAAEPPIVIGVLPNYKDIQSLKIVEGRFFNEEEDARSAPVCVLGESAKVNLLGYEPAVGKYVKDERHMAAGDRRDGAAGRLGHGRGRRRNSQPQ